MCSIDQLPGWLASWLVPLLHYQHKKPSKRDQEKRKKKRKKKKGAKNEQEDKKEEEEDGGSGSGTIEERDAACIHREYKSGARKGEKTR